MKRTIFGLTTAVVVFLTVLAVFAVRPLRTVKAHHGCSNGTLMGNYGWTEFGYEPENDPVDSWTATALLHFDGHGNLTGTNVYSVNNGVLGAVTDFTDASYVVSSDCTVTITYTWQSGTYTEHGVVVGADGSEVMASEYSAANDTTGHVDIRKVGDSD